MIDEVRLTPVLIADPPLLNTQGVHQPYTPRLIVEVVTRGGVTGVGETYGDGKYLELARPLARAVTGRPVSDVNGLFALAEEVCGDSRAADERVDAGGLRGVQNAEKLRLSVVSGFEVACLDALGKTLGLPVHALLGGKVRDSVEYSAYLFHRWAAHPDGGEWDGWGTAQPSHSPTTTTGADYTAPANWPGPVLGSPRAPPPTSVSALPPQNLRQPLPFLVNE